jgi:NAD+ kinase
MSNQMLNHMETIFHEVREYMLSEGYRKLGVYGTGIKTKDITKEFDIGAENTIIKYCKKHGLPLVLHTEEQGIVDLASGKAEYRMMSDPCDGSTNFGSGIEGSAVAISLNPFTEDGALNPKDVECALIGSIMTGAYVDGAKGEGVFYKGPFSGFELIPVRTSKNENIHAARVEIDLDFGLNEAAGFTKEKTNMKRILRLIQTGIKNIRRNGSAAMGLSYVPTGAVDAYVDVRDVSTPENWMGAYLLVREAGGIFTDPFGGDIGKVKDMVTPYNYVASGNEKIHKAILERLDMS